jgi:hypothetical protein
MCTRRTASITGENFSGTVESLCFSDDPDKSDLGRAPAAFGTAATCLGRNTPKPTRPRLIRVETTAQPGLPRLIRVEITVRAPLGDSFGSKLPCRRHSATHLGRNYAASGTGRLISVELRRQRHLGDSFESKGRLTRSPRDWLESISASAPGSSERSEFELTVFAGWSEGKQTTIYTSSK